MAKKTALSAVFFFSLLVPIMASTASAVPLDQYASTVVGFSSQWSPSSWSAEQALGAPNTTSYGDIASAWAPGPTNGTLEWISLGFETAVYANGLSIWETYGNGFVYQVDVIDQSDALHTVWTGQDTSTPGTVAKFDISWALTSFLIDGVKIYTNTDHNPNAWEEIDAVQLHGETNAAPVPEPGTFILLGVGLAGIAAYRRKV